MLTAMNHRVGISLAICVAALVWVAGCAGSGRVPRDEVEAGESRKATSEMRRLPVGWFTDQRQSGQAAIPPAVRARALDDLRARGYLTRTAGAWTNVGPVNIGGRVTALAVDPNNSTRLWLGSADGGVFVSTNEGTNWNPVFDGQTALSIGSIAAHPASSSIVYVGTGEDNGGGFSYDGEGVFKTTDGGATWVNLGLSEVRRIGRIAIDPANPQRVFVAAGGDWFSRDANRGIYRSTDGGSTWDKVLYVADDAGGIDIAIDPVNTSRIYAAIWQRQSLGVTWYIGGTASAIYRSEDGGNSWTRLAGGLPSGSQVGRIGIAIAPSNPSTVYALVIDGQGLLLGIYKSINAGDTWTLANNMLSLNGFSYYFGNIRVDPANASTIYVLDSGLFRSTNGGTSFTRVASSEHPDWHDLIITGTRLIAGNDAGFYRSKNGGSSWFHAVTLPITQIYGLGIDRLQPNRRFAGSQDNGVLRTTTGGVSNWQGVLDSDGFQCVVDYTNSNYVYAEYQYGSIFRSTNGGSGFTIATTGIPGTERANWNSPLTMDPVVPSILYTGAQRVYRSTDRALSWISISPDLTGGPGPGPDVSGDPDWRNRFDHLQDLIRGTVTVVSVSPVDTRILWAGTDDGNVWVTDNAGTSWTQVNPPGTAYWVTDIACDPFEASAAYLTVTGFRQGDRLPYVRVTRDLGATWMDLGGTLPQVPVNTIVPDPAWRGRLFAGSDLGAHMSDDGGVTWSFLGSGMPYLVVMDLALHAPGRTLFAGTHGRSIYSYDLNQLPVADGDGDGVDNNHDCALADPGTFAPPVLVTPLLIEPAGVDGAALAWPSQTGSAGQGTAYDVATGDLAGLRAAGTGASAALACGLTTSTTTDEGALPVNTGVYYFVRARNACGTTSWGTDSHGVPRSSPACP